MALPEEPCLLRMIGDATGKSSLSHLCLACIGNICKHVTCLLGLQGLTLLGFGGKKCDLSYCTQLNSVELSDFDSSHLWLPDGQVVALQCCRCSAVEDVNQNCAIGFALTNSFDNRVPPKCLHSHEFVF